MKELKYRMYGFVPYNLSEIQKGIQFGHAVVEYANNYFNDKLYQKWSKHDKTFIILNGGTTNNKDTFQRGSLNILLDTFKTNFPNLNLGVFTEPDLGDQLTSFCFLVSEYVWDDLKYPEGMTIKGVNNNRHLELRHLLQNYKLA